MKRRWARRFALLWAVLQVLSPGASALADGLIARQNANAPLVHVEATGSQSCPEIHSPDCGVCRYLSSGGDAPAAPALVLLSDAAAIPVSALVAPYVSSTATLPHGRAPPLV